MSLNKIFVNNIQITSVDEKATPSSQNLINSNGASSLRKTVQFNREIFSFRYSVSERWNYKLLDNIFIPSGSILNIKIAFSSNNWTRICCCINENFIEQIVNFYSSEYHTEEYVVQRNSEPFQDDAYCIGFWAQITEPIDFEVTFQNTDIKRLESLEETQSNLTDNISTLIPAGCYVPVFRSYDETTWDSLSLFKKVRLNQVLWARFTNFDASIPRRVWFIWNNGNYTQEIGIAKYQNGSWQADFRLKDSNNTTGNHIRYMTYISGDQKAEFLIEFKNEDSGSIIFNHTDTDCVIFSENVYASSEQPTPTPTVELFAPKTIRLYPNTKLPVFSFEFDDINAKDYLFYDLFKSYGTTCGFAFIASESNIQNKTKEYLKYQQEGFSILNHSINGTIFNTTNYTYDTAQEAIETAQRRLEKAGFVINGWVSPSSSMEPSFIPIIKNNFAYASTYNDTYQNGRQSNPCETTRTGIASRTLEQTKATIDANIANDKITTFYAHAHDLDKDYGAGTFTIEIIASIIEYILQKQALGLCKLMSPDDARAYYFDL